MIEVRLPQPGEGWGDLITTPRFNGGDAYPPGLADLVDGALGRTSSVGVTVDGTPSVLFTLQPVALEDGRAEVLIHWCSDGRLPLSQSLDVLGEIVRGHPGTRFLAFCRRPALVRLLAGRGWTLRTHEDDPFMALMVCQSGLDVTPEWGHESLSHAERG